MAGARRKVPKLGTLFTRNVSLRILARSRWCFGYTASLPHQRYFVWRILGRLSACHEPTHGWIDLRDSNRLTDICPGIKSDVVFFSSAVKVSAVGSGDSAVIHGLLGKKHRVWVKSRHEEETQIRHGGRKSVVSTETSSAEALAPLHPDILEEVFLNLPAHVVVTVCRLVCRQWKDVTDRESLWRERCRREGYHLRDASTVPSNWMLFYFLCKKRRNLLKNPRGEDNFRGWKILENNGDRWTIEGVMVPHPNAAVQKNFVTSYGMCTKEQVINLKNEGYNPSFMDEFQPHIRISDWYAPRQDCGSIYMISVQLLNHKKEILHEFNPELISFPQWNDQEWNQMIHVFKNYGPGVRYVRFVHGGKDTQFWAGWYGIRVTDSCVEVCPASDT